MGLPLAAAAWGFWRVGLGAWSSLEIFIHLQRPGLVSPVPVSQGLLGKDLCLRVLARPVVCSHGQGCLSRKSLMGWMARVRQRLQIGTQVASKMRLLLSSLSQGSPCFSLPGEADSEES